MPITRQSIDQVMDRCRIRGKQDEAGTQNWEFPVINQTTRHPYVAFPSELYNYSNNWLHSTSARHSPSTLL